MNYLKEVNAFHVWSMLHPEVSMSARILWYVLMHFNNIGFWQKTFSLSMDTLAAATGLSRAKLTEAHVILQKSRPHSLHAVRWQEVCDIRNYFDGR